VTSNRKKLKRCRRGQRAMAGFLSMQTKRIRDLENLVASGAAANVRMQQTLRSVTNEMLELQARLNEIETPPLAE